MKNDMVKTRELLTMIEETPLFKRTQERLENAQNQIISKEKEIAEKNKEIESLKAKLAEKNKEIESVNTELQSLKRKINYDSLLIP